MTTLAQILAVAAGVLHVAVGIVEIAFFRRPWAQQLLLRTTTSPREVDLWAFNVGFYNVFLGAGTMLGVVLARSGSVDVGRALVLYTAGFMTLGGIALWVSDHRLWTGTVGQSGFGLATLLATLGGTAGAAAG